CTRLDYSFDYW
nr:immunoglobulin heavy chain junction region [Mus musculus]